MSSIPIRMQTTKTLSEPNLFPLPKIQSTSPSLEVFFNSELAPLETIMHTKLTGQPEVGEKEGRQVSGVSDGD